MKVEGGGLREFINEPLYQDDSGTKGESSVQIHHKITRFCVVVAQVARVNANIACLLQRKSVCVCHRRVSRFWGDPGNFWGILTNSWEASGLLLKSTSRIVSGKSQGNFWASSAKFSEVQELSRRSGKSDSLPAKRRNCLQLLDLLRSSLLNCFVWMDSLPI